MEKALKGKRGEEAEQTLLKLKVCDPACGSGHFLVAAAHRLASRLATIRSGEDEPSLGATRRALRDVISHCLYGVDLNPMAGTMPGLALDEAMSPGKPLAFLEHHIRCGNSLLGVTPRLLRQGIPNDAFKPIEGDSKSFCTALKNKNKEERKARSFEGTRIRHEMDKSDSNQSNWKNL